MSVEQKLREADRVGYALSEIVVELRRIGDALDRLTAGRNAPPRQPPAEPSPAREPSSRRSRGDERRNTAAATRTCATCGQEFAPMRVWEKRCAPCFDEARGRPRAADPDDATAPPRFGPY